MNSREDFERDGLLACVDILPPERTAYYAGRFVEFIEQYREHPNYPEWTYGKTELLLGWVVELASEKVLLDVVESLIGHDILLWNAFLPAKAPRTSGLFGWHQDATYWPVTPTERIVSAWVALSIVNQACGAMRMVRGSHQLGPVSHKKTFDVKSMLKRGQRADVDANNPNVVCIDLAPGQASFHHTLTLHCSGPNESNNWRLGVGLNYAAGEVAPRPGHSDSAMLLRGVSANTGFVLEEPPNADLSPRALANFAEAARRQKSRYADVSAAS